MTFDTFFGLFNQTRYQGNLIYAQVLYAQALVETSVNGEGFRSNLCVNHKNLFGMRPSVKRQKLYQGVVNTQGNGDFAEYDSDYNSLLDRINLDEFNNTQMPQSSGEVAHYMKEVLRKGYAPETHYLASWTSYYNQVASGSNHAGFSPAGDLESADGEGDVVGQSGIPTVVKFAIPLIVLVLLWKFGKPLLRKIPIIKNLV